MYASFVQEMVEIARCQLGGLHCKAVPVRTIAESVI